MGDVYVRRGFVLKLPTDLRDGLLAEIVVCLVLVLGERWRYGRSTRGILLTGRFVDGSTVLPPSYDSFLRTSPRCLMLRS